MSKIVRYRFSKSSGGYVPVDRKGGRGRPGGSKKTHPHTADDHKHAGEGWSDWAKKVYSRGRDVLGRGVSKARDLSASAIKKIYGESSYQHDAKRCITYDGSYQIIQYLKQALESVREFYQSVGHSGWLRACDEQLNDLNEVENRLQSDQNSWRKNDPDLAVVVCADAVLIDRLHFLRDNVQLLQGQRDKDKIEYAKPSVLLSQLNRRHQQKITPTATASPTPTDQKQSSLRVDQRDIDILRQLSFADAPAGMPSLTPATNVDFTGLSAAVSAPSDPHELYRTILNTLPDSLQGLIPKLFTTRDQQLALLPILQNPAIITPAESLESTCRLNEWSRIKPDEVRRFNDLPLRSSPRLKLEILRRLVQIPHCTNATPPMRSSDTSFDFVGVGAGRPSAPPAPSTASSNRDAQMQSLLNSLSDRALAELD